MTTTPSTNKSGPKVKTPSPFNKQRESSRLFILECKVYFRAKPKEFMDDAEALDEQRKVLFTLSYLEGGTAKT
ncbi:hypothetical protein EW146_g5566 [Bondarzewia mesenterica]|uniref:Uncharacterized protein n=1 Tax=Bondarzewia mesenterica TaxID=1095465 RepID=A0A4S4LSZ4_9AGAM|nr:hypothetical protein EW146_g5566 [Bondarzewia mesenterica]